MRMKVGSVDQSVIPRWKKWRGVVRDNVTDPELTRVDDGRLYDEEARRRLSARAAGVDQCETTGNGSE
jgi:hypothetical protein